MYQCRATNFAENQKYFICSTYRKGKDLCTTHSIKMSHDYELEQSNLKSMAEVLRKDLKQQERQKTNVRAFIAAVKKYTDLQELDAAVLRAFIDRIEVSHVDKKSRTREITIVYNFIGAFDFTRAIENDRNTSKKEQRTA